MNIPDRFRFYCAQDYDWWLQCLQAAAIVTASQKQSRNPTKIDTIVLADRFYIALRNRKAKAE